MTLKPFWKFKFKAWSLVNLETRLCLLKQSWINLEANVYPLKQPCLILLWHHQNHHTFTFSPFLIMTIKWFLFNIIKTMHDPHSSPFLWWRSLSSKFSLTSSKPAWFTFSPFFMMTITYRLGATITTKKYSFVYSFTPPLFCNDCLCETVEDFISKKPSHKDFYLFLPLCQHKKQIMNREEKKCYHLLQCIKIKWCQKTLKQSFNINQAKTNTITHQSNTINHQTFQIKLIKLTIN